VLLQFALDANLLSRRVIAGVKAPDQTSRMSENEPSLPQELIELMDASA
jgi:hypothetical protein